MTYTKHGHHIVGTPFEEPEPESRARCGGPGVCAACSREAARIRKHLQQEMLSKVGLCYIDASLLSDLRNLTDNFGPTGVLNTLLKMWPELREPDKRPASFVVRCSDHKPVQHRDGKSPWCNECRLTAEGRVPTAIWASGPTKREE